MENTSRGGGRHMQWLAYSNWFSSFINDLEFTMIEGSSLIIIIIIIIITSA